MLALQVAEPPPGGTDDREAPAALALPASLVGEHGHLVLLFSCLNCHRGLLVFVRTKPKPHAKYLPKQRAVLAMIM